VKLNKLGEDFNYLFNTSIYKLVNMSLRKVIANEIIYSVYELIETTIWNSLGNSEVVYLADFIKKTLRKGEL